MATHHLHAKDMTSDELLEDARFGVENLTKMRFYPTLDTSWAQKNVDELFGELASRLHRLDELTNNVDVSQ